MHEVICERLLVALQLHIPTRLTDHNSLANALRVGEKFLEAHSGNQKLVRSSISRSSSGIAVSYLVKTLDQVTGVLEFSRNEEGSRHRNSFRVDALLINAALSNLTSPEILTRPIRITVKEVAVILSDEKRAVINRIAREQ